MYMYVLNAFAVIRFASGPSANVAVFELERILSLLVVHSSPLRQLWTRLGVHSNYISPLTHEMVSCPEIPCKRGRIGTLDSLTSSGESRN
jgi:hypothetical protein